MKLDHPELLHLMDAIMSARAKGRALDIVGGGTKRFFGEEPSGEPLDVRYLTGISSYEPSELVITARAGTPVTELEAALAEHHQHLPFDPRTIVREARWAAWSRRASAGRHESVQGLSGILSLAPPCSTVKARCLRSAARS